MIHRVIHLLHLCMVTLFIIAPVAALVNDVRRAHRRRRTSPSPSFVATLCAGIAIGTSVSVAYAVVAGAYPSAVQITLASYFAAALLFLLKAADNLLRDVLTKVLGHRVYRVFLDSDSNSAVAGHVAGQVPAMIRRYTGMRRPSVISSCLRIGLLFGLGLPYILAAGLTYRPKVVPLDNPQNKLGLAFESVDFESTDGVRIAGWWIAANSGHRRTRVRSTSTVVICPGPGAGKATALPLVNAFAPYGYNVLLLDFRATGQSDGQITSFGDLERQDVLGAINWLQRDHPDQSRRLYGVGIETGGAALIGAAADSSPAGQAVNAVAVIGGFNTLRELSYDLTSDNFLPPLNWLMSSVGLRMAGVQCGANLNAFAPADQIALIWPRPVFVIHGAGDRTFPMELGRRLYESASQPKHSRWVSGDATNLELLSDVPTATAIRNFFRTAEPVPVI